jgi:hypothetical protein
MANKESVDQKIERLLDFQRQLERWEDEGTADARRFLNQNMRAVKRDLIESGCFRTYTIAPPPAVGGMIMRNVDPIEMMFDPPYLMSFVPKINDMIDQAVVALREEPDEEEEEDDDEPRVQEDAIQPGYVFIAMPMAADDSSLQDVHDTIKHACQNCGLQAERVDDVEHNERITDRMLESLRRAQFVIADLTSARPNVFYEAGYAHGRGKTPIYVARDGTALEFDLKDYPVIFFRNMRELREGLERRLRALANLDV